MSLWGNVAIFYGECGEAVGLYELGWAISGAEKIENLNGEKCGLKAAEALPKTRKIHKHRFRRLFYTNTVRTGHRNAAGEKGNDKKMYVQVGHRTFIATLESNAAAMLLLR